MDYFSDESHYYRIKREVVDTTLVHKDNPVIEEREYLFDTLDQAFDCFEKMYKMDRAFYAYLINGKCANKFFDESKKPVMYTFSIGSKMLTVKLFDIEKIADEVFHIQGG